MPGDSLKLVITAFKHDRFLSGINMCINKPSSIYLVEEVNLEDLFPDKQKKKDEQKKTDDEKESEDVPLLKWSDEVWPGEVN